MIEYETRINDRVINTFSKELEVLPETLAKIISETVEPKVKAYVGKELVPYPPPIAPGVFKRFATPKQRAAVMRKIRLKQWTGRTGALAGAWFVRSEPIAGGTAVIVGNTSKIATYVIGDDRQPFHRVTGWKNLTGESAVDEIQRIVVVETTIAVYDLMDKVLEG